MKFKRMLALAVAGIMTASIPAAVSAAGRYSDLDGHWARNDIEELSDMGIIQGSDGKIRPEDNISRAELVTIVYNMVGTAGETNSSEYSYNETTKLWDSSASAGSDRNVGGFSDYQADKWYAYALNWAVGNGVISGYEDGTIKADNPVTRQEAIVILMRALSIGNAGGQITSNDAAEVSDWARDAVSSFMKLGYVNGDTDGNVNPKANIKRGEAFKLLRNMIGAYITANGEFSGNYGNKLVIVADGNIILTNINCRAILVSARAGEPEVKGRAPKIKIFGRKKLKVTKESGIVINSGSGSSWGGGGSSSGGGGSQSAGKATVRFNANGGSFEKNKEVYTVYCTKGATIKREIPDDPVRDGYEFIGWFEGRDKADDADEKYLYNTSKKVSGSMTLYAGWIEDDHYADFKEAKLEDKSAQPQTELIKDYEIALKSGNKLKISGKELKKYMYESTGEERHWIGFEVMLSDRMLDAIEDGELLGWYIGDKNKEKDIEWTGLIEDELTGSKDYSFTVYIDAEKSDEYDYFVLELPRSSSDDIMVYSLDMSELKLYDYKSEPVESSGVFIDVTENAELMENVVLEISMTELNTFDASGTLKFFTVSEEESGNYIELAITLPQSVDTEKAVVMLGNDAVEDLTALRVPVSAETAEIVITVDFDGEGEEFSPVSYKVTTGGLTLGAAPEEPIE